MKVQLYCVFAPCLGTRCRCQSTCYNVKGRWSVKSYSSVVGSNSFSLLAALLANSGGKFHPSNAVFIMLITIKLG